MRPLLSLILLTIILTPALFSLICLSIFARPALSHPLSFFADPSAPNTSAATTTVRGDDSLDWDNITDAADAETLRGEAQRADFERLREEAANRTAYENSQKYFHEPASHEIGADDRLGHYDSRFFRRQLAEEEKRASQVHMVRAFLDTFREQGVETWLAHGTLLGWYWNKQVRATPCDRQRLKQMT